MPDERSAERELLSQRFERSRDTSGHLRLLNADWVVYSPCHPTCGCADKSGWIARPQHGGEDAIDITDPEVLLFLELEHALET